MAARKRFAGSVGSPLLPRVENVVLLVHRTSFGPQRQNRATDFALQIRIIMHQVDGSAGAVVLASRVNHLGSAEGSEIFGKGFFVDRAGRKAIEARFEPKLGAIADHRFRERLRLDQEKPVKIRCGEFLGNGMKDLVRGYDIEDYELLHAVGVVESHSMRHSPSAIMTDDQEFLESEAVHHLDLV